MMNYNFNDALVRLLRRVGKPLALCCFCAVAAHLILIFPGKSATRFARSAAPRLANCRQHTTSAASRETLCAALAHT
jgi:hypothetical protein